MPEGPQDKPYNPLDYDNLTINLVRELMSRGPFRLPPDHAFRGPGVYALFYTGKLDFYAPIRSRDATVPIYVGKAVPPGARKGGGPREIAASAALYGRLRQHSDSIAAAPNLELKDFVCRYLVVVPLWITMAERFLVEHFRPVWNVCIEGFGLHDPGSGRHAGEISWWDVLHSGRPWAARLRQTREMKHAQERLSAFFAEAGTKKLPESPL